VNLESSHWNSCTVCVQCVYTTVSVQLRHIGMLESMQIQTTWRPGINASPSIRGSSLPSSSVQPYSTHIFITHVHCAPYQYITCTFAVKFICQTVITTIINVTLLQVLVVIACCVCVSVCHTSVLYQKMQHVWSWLCINVSLNPYYTVY